MEELIFLHDFINLILIFIISFVGYIMLIILYNKYINIFLLESQIIECIWTIIPAIILIQIAIPSLLLLYILDESIDSSLTIKIIGHQWHWRYEYTDFWLERAVGQIEPRTYQVSIKDQNGQLSDPAPAVGQTEPKTHRVPKNKPGYAPAVGQIEPKTHRVRVPINTLGQACFPAPPLKIKIIGHQWYWRYEYTDFWSVRAASQIEFDAYMVPTNELERNIFRLLDVDNRTVLPYNIHIRILISSSDVLHAWTVPSLGVKADAVPGRLNQIKFISQRPGIFFGQCSEICGANHRFIPISLEIVKINSFLNWVSCIYE